MFYSPAFIFSSVYSLGFWFLAGLRLLASRQFLVFFASIASLPWHTAFSRFAPVVNLWLPVLASGSNRAVKPTCLRQAAYFRSLAPQKTHLFSPCLFKRHSISQALFSAGFVVSLGFAWWRYAGFWSFWPLAVVQQAQAAIVLVVLRRLGGAVLFRS